jgi:hypothetical protein
MTTLQKLQHLRYYSLVEEKCVPIIREIRESYLCDIDIQFSELVNKRKFLRSIAGRDNDFTKQNLERINNLVDELYYKWKESPNNPEIKFDYVFQWIKKKSETQLYLEEHMFVSVLIKYIYYILSKVNDGCTGPEFEIPFFSFAERNEIEDEFESHQKLFKEEIYDFVLFVEEKRKEFWERRKKEISIEDLVKYITARPNHILSEYENYERNRILSTDALNFWEKAYTLFAADTDHIFIDTKETLVEIGPDGCEIPSKQDMITDVKIVMRGTNKLHGTKSSCFVWSIAYTDKYANINNILETYTRTEEHKGYILQLPFCRTVIKIADLKIDNDAKFFVSYKRVILARQLRDIVLNSTIKYKDYTLCQGTVVK